MLLPDNFTILTAVSLASIAVCNYLKIDYRIISVALVYVWAQFIGQNIIIAFKNGKISAISLGWLLGIGQSDLQSSDGIVSQISRVVVNTTSEICKSVFDCGGTTEGFVKSLVWLFILITAGKFLYIVANFNESVKLNSVNEEHTNGGKE